MDRLEFRAIHIEDVTGRSLDRAALELDVVRASLFSILESNALCSIATVTLEGMPHINTAYFSYSDTLELYFLSHPRSLHCRNLVANESMAMTVFSSAQRWTDPGQGVQLFGVCNEANGALADEAERCYGDRFHDYWNWKRALADSDRAREYRFYLFRVDRVKILDERVFGDAVFVRVSFSRH